MWEQLNEHLSHHSRKRPVLAAASPGANCPDPLRLPVFLWHHRDATLSRDLSWQFSKLGRLVDRAEKNSRILDVQVFSCVCQPPRWSACGPMKLQVDRPLRSAGAYQCSGSRSRSHRPQGRRLSLYGPDFSPLRALLPGRESTNPPAGEIRGNPVASPPDDLECLKGLSARQFGAMCIG